MNKRILVVDDEPSIRGIFQKTLSQPGKDKVLSKGAALFSETSQSEESPSSECYDVTLVDRGEKALKEVGKSVEEKRPFAVAFIDMSMPGMDGSETARKVREMDPNIKIAIVSGSNNRTAEDFGGSEEKSQVYFLAKPFSLEKLKEFTRSLIQTWVIEQNDEEE